MRYDIIFDPGALREFDRLPKSAQAKLSEVIDCLAEEPRPRGSVKMAGVDAYRVRAGDYRAIYAVKEKPVNYTGSQSGSSKRGLQRYWSHQAQTESVIGSHKLIVAKPP